MLHSFKASHFAARTFIPIWGKDAAAVSAPLPGSKHSNRIPARKGARLRRLRHEDEDILLVLMQ